MKYNDEELKYLREQANEFEETLRRAVVESCPGPHEPRQHRDRNEAWCNVCGRSARGRAIKAMLSD